MVASERRLFSGENELSTFPACWLRVLLRVVTRPYVLVVIVSYFVVLPHWEVHWFVGLLCCIGVVICFVIASERRPGIDLPNLDGVDVIRDYTHLWLPAAALVPGDIIVLRSSMVLSCDVVLLTQHVVVQEEKLTGNIVPCRKYHIPDIKSRRGQELKLEPSNRIWARSRVEQVAPNTLAVVTNVGVRTQLGLMTRDVWKCYGGSVSAVRKAWNGVRRINVSRRLARDISFQLEFVVVVHLAKVAMRGAYFAYDNFVYQQRSSLEFGGMMLATLTFMLRDLIFSELPWICINVAILLLPWFLCRLWFAWLLQRKSNVRCNLLQSMPVAGHIDMMMFDKTGTLTQPHMQLCSVFPAGEMEFSAKVDCQDGILSSAVPRLVQLALACCHKVTRSADGSIQGCGLDVAMFVASGWHITHSESTGRWCAVPPSGTECPPVELLHSFCFEPAHGTSGVVVQHGQELLLFVKSSLEALLPLSNGSFDKRRAMQHENAIPAGQYGVAVAMRKLPPNTDVRELPRQQLVTDLTMVAYLSFSNEVRKDSADVVERLHSAGIRTFLATGDHVHAGVQVGRTVGLLAGDVPTIVGDVYVPQPQVRRNVTAGSTLATTEVLVWPSSRPAGSDVHDFVEDDEDDEQPAPHVVVWKDVDTGERFAEQDVLSAGRGTVNIVVSGPALCRLAERVTLADSDSSLECSGEKDLFKRLVPNLRAGARLAPGEKKMLVQLFREQGNVVGYVGDGWNDGPALSSADIGIALASDISQLPSSFTASIPSVGVIPDVILHGRSCLAAAVGVLLFGFVHILVGTFGQLLLEGPRGALHSVVVTRTDIFHMTMPALLSVSMIFFPAVRRLQKISIVRELLSEWTTIWTVFQLVVAFCSLAIVRFLIVMEPSIDDADLDWVRQYGSEELYRTKLQTPESSLFALFGLWFLCTIAFSAALSWYDPHRLFRLRSPFLFIAIATKLMILALLWAGPSAVTCRLGFNCDNAHAYDLTNSCLYGPQLLGLNRQYGSAFFMPRPNSNNAAVDQSRCRYVRGASANPDISMGITVFPPGLWQNQCLGPNNCIASATRWQFTGLLVSVSLLSAAGSLTVGWSFRRRHS